MKLLDKLFKYFKKSNDIENENLDWIDDIQASPKPLYERNERNQITHYKSYDPSLDYTYEYWKEYDENGNMIHFHNTDGADVKVQYKNNKEIYVDDNNGGKLYRKYDNDGNLIYYKNIGTAETVYKYDSNGNVIHHRVCDNFKNENKFDEKGRIISHTDLYETITWEYDDEEEC